MNDLLTPFQNVAAAASLISLLMTASCSTAASGSQNISPNMIYYIGTPQYDKKVKEFKVKPEEAQRLVTEYMQKELSSTNPKIKPTGIHQLIVGNAYHFYMPRKITVIPLTGYYVDGNTGKVDYRNVEGSVHSPYQK
jgi:hypothetical protein